MNVQPKSLTDITSQAIHVLSREIGAADTMRFLGRFSIGAGNYTEDRAALFDYLSLDDILTGVRENQDGKMK